MKKKVRNCFYNEIQIISFFLTCIEIEIKKKYLNMYLGRQRMNILKWTGSEYTGWYLATRYIKIDKAS